MKKIIYMIFFTIVPLILLFLYDYEKMENRAEEQTKLYKKEKYRHIDNLFADYYVEEVLNGEVEIIEEDKKVEKIDEELFEKASSSYRERIMKDKINEIIDYLEEKE